MRFAINQNIIIVVRFILENKYIDPNDKTESWINMAILAIHYQYEINNTDYNLDIIKLLVEFGFKLNPHDTSLLDCIFLDATDTMPDWLDDKYEIQNRNRRMLVEYFVSDGLNVNMRDSKSQSIIQYATDPDEPIDPAYIEFLLAHGVNVNDVFPDGNTLFIRVAMNWMTSFDNAKRVVLLLLEYGADAGFRNGKTGKCAHDILASGLKYIVQTYVNVANMTKGVHLDDSLIDKN